MSIASASGTEVRINSPRLQDFLSAPQRLLINGEWVQSSTAQNFKTYDPATGNVLAEVAQGTESDINAAVDAARKAFNEGSWVRMRPNMREDLLWMISQKILEWADDFAELESLDNGKPVGI